MFGTRSPICYLPVQNLNIMKVKVMAILMLIAVSCQKEKMPQQAASNSTLQTENAKAATQLANDPNFVRLYNISLPIFNALKHG